MRNKRILCILVGVALVVIGIILITEGGFRISHITYDEIPQYAIQDVANGSPWLQKFSERKDVAISVYMDSNSIGTFYILEFSRNTISNRYSLVDTHICTVTGQPFYSVVSTAFYDYAYCVDLPNLSVEIFEENISSTLYYSIFILSLGIGFCFYKKKGDTI